MAEIDKTVEFNIKGDYEHQIKEIMRTVFLALKEKGYNPVSQIVGYLLSEDPTYITTHNNARNLISRIDRDELLQIMVSDYVKPDEKGE